MAGIGSAWGSREEMLHPRDRHGRFRKKWKMAAGVVDALTGFLDRFQPHSFQSDQQASQYAFNHRKAPWSTPELQRLHTDWDDANESLQAGEMDDTTKKFVDMMDRNMVETSEDLIVSQTVPPEAFGMSAQQAQLEDGGLEDFIGLEIADAGYSAMNLGSELSHPPGSITLRVAVPKGTRAAMGGRSPNDRQMFLDRDQPLVVTKVEPDGRGGWYMLAIAGSGRKTKGATAVADDRTHARRGSGLTPEQREARVSPQMSGEQRFQAAERERKANEAATLAHQQQVQGQPSPPTEQGQTPAPAAPASPQTPASPATGVPERREPVLKESVGPGSPEGKSPSDIATDAEAARVQAENAPPPPPAPPSPADFRAATADIPSPAAGKRRVQWNKAHQGVVTGKRDPQDVLRELDTDIQVAKVSQDRIKRGEDPPDPNLDSDIDSMEKLADAISQHSGAPRRGQQSQAPAAPVKKVAKKAGPTPTPGAPSTKREATPAPKKAGKRPAADIAKDVKGAGTREEAASHLEGLTGPELREVATETGTPLGSRATKDQMKRAIVQHGVGRRLDSDAISGNGARMRGDDTTDNERRLIEAAKKYRGKERNSEEERIVAQADEILARGKGPETRSEMRKRTAGPGLTDEQKADIKAKADRTNERMAKEQEDFDAKNKADLDPLLEAAGLQEDDLDALDKTGANLILGQVREKKISKVEGVRRLKASKSPQLRALGEALEAKPRKTTAKKAVPEAPTAPAKAVAKKAAPAKAVPQVDAAEEAFKARVAEAGLPDKVTDLRAMAREKKIRGFSTMNKKQLQSALLGDEVPRAGKIAPVTPKKLIPHIQAAKSDQEARGLLENHTLADLRAMAKDPDVGVTLPSRGVTKDKAKDAILEAIRGVPEGGKGETPARSLRQELDAQKWVAPEDGVAKRAVEDILSDTNEMDAAELRDGRDKLENLSKDLRTNGKRQDAGLVQTLADTMGMRAQVISGVEEGPARAPAKRAVKKAMAAVPEGEAAPKPLEKMLKTELEKVASDEGVPNVRKSWTKARLQDEIKKNRGAKERGNLTEEDRIRQGLEAVPVEAPAAAKKAAPVLAVPDRAPTPEEIARDNPELPPTKKAVKRVPKKQAQETADKAAAAVSEQVKGTFGDQLRQEDPESVRQAARAVGIEPEGNTSEEIFDNTLKQMIEGRMRELGMLPEDSKKPTRATKRVPRKSVAGPKADTPIETPGRAQSFTEAWNDKGFAGRSDAAMDEIRDDVASGKLTPEEGIRRMETEIAFNKDDLADTEAKLRGELTKEERADLVAERKRLKQSIEANTDASSFMRDHFKNETPITREELEVKLDGPEKAALQRVEVDDLKAAAKAEGLGDIEGDDKDTVVANIGKAMQRRELANQEKEQKARDLQARKDVVRQHAEAISGIESVMGGSDRAVQARIRSQSKVSKLSPELRQELLDNAGDRTALQGVLDRVARENGLRRIDTRGQETHFDPERHDLPPGSGIQKGDPVTVLEPGFRSDVEGHDVQVKKAKVTEGHGGVPGGEPTGVSTPAQAPVQAAPGTAAGRITTSRLTPGTRIMVQPGTSEGSVMPTTKKTGAIPVTVTSVEGVGAVGPRGRGKYRVTVTDDDGNVLKLGDRGASQTHMLEPPPKAPKAIKAPAPVKKVAKAARPGPISPAEVKEQLSNIENPPSREESKALLERLNGRDIRPMAKELHIPTSGKTNDQIRDEIIEATSGRLADAKVSRGFGGTTPTSVPVRTGETTSEAFQRTRAAQAAKAAVPAKATPAPVVDLDNPTRHNAELIGTGLDLDPDGQDKQWLKIVQEDLDKGTDGRQIADGLRREADAQRTIHNIQEASGGTAGASPEARINRMELMADRLEGVRPIKAAPATPAKAAPSSAPAKREMDTMQAATAQSKALFDLRNGKSHTEVATDLRKAATGVGSREHDPQTVRPLEFTPSERSAMKRNDAKKLRELAAEIQAQGVAQRAEARAAKKAVPTKAPAKKAAVNPNLSSLSDDELRKIIASDQFPQSQKDKVQKELDARARRDLTGVTGELIKAQLDDAMRRLQEADTPEAERSALAGLLRPELAQLADRLGVKRDRAKSVMINGIIERVKGREAPGASAERAVPKTPRADLSPEAARATADVLSNPENISPPRPGAVNESVPMQPYSKTDNMRMHVDSPTMGLVKAYEAAGRNGSANEMLDLRRRATEKGGSTTPQQVVDELKAMRARETDPKFQRELDRAISANDSPMTPMPDLPANTPPAARDLIERLHAIPYARKGTGEDAAIGTVSGDSLVNQVADVLRQLASGESRQQPEMRLRQILTQKVHEMNEPSFRIWELADLLEPVTDAQGRRRPSPLTLALREMRPK